MNVSGHATNEEGKGEESKTTESQEQGACAGNENLGDGELAQAIISSRGIAEGWLYKTSQKLGFFQADLFHKRYYRLNLMTEELKIFDKPDGSVKHMINLSQCVTKIDMQLNKHILAEHEKKLGADVNLPDFNHPFAVFTE